MGNESDASAMDVNLVKLGGSDQVVPRFSVNVLQLLKSAQMQHGLRHGDYARYRRYCTARLRRLYKSLKFTHGRNKYTKREITQSTVTEVRFLHLLLYTAERAWSHAMEKRQLPDGPNARQRIYLIGRLRKAVKWANLFSQLCAVKGDTRTSLEAEAYASYMKGSLLFEQDRNWESALVNFKRARAVYEELGKYGDLENQVLCRERVEELEPSIRHCMHKLGESNLPTSELLHIGEMEGPALDLFKAKLEKKAGILIEYKNYDFSTTSQVAMAEARSQQAASLTEFQWLGHKFPISNAKTRVSILKAKDLEEDLYGPVADSLSSEKRLSVFDKIFAAYHEARSSIRSDLASAGNAESVKDDLNGLDKAISALLGHRTIDRNQLLVRIAKGKLSKRRDEKNERVTKPEELVRLYDLLLQNAADLSDLLSSGRDRKAEEVSFAEELESRSLIFRAERCFYLAWSYSLTGKRPEAYALYGRTRSLAEKALQRCRSWTNCDQSMTKELESLHGECRSNSCMEHAAGIIEEHKGSDNLSKKVSALSLSGADKKVEKLPMEKLDVYESAVGDASTKGAPRIVAFPPAFEAVPRNPIVLDLVYNLLEFPSLENRMRKDNKGFISRLWR